MVLYRRCCYYYLHKTKSNTSCHQLRQISSSSSSSLDYLRNALSRWTKKQHTDERQQQHRPNPVLEFIVGKEQKDNDNLSHLGGNNSSSSNVSASISHELPRFADIRPNDLVTAAKVLQSRNEQDLLSLEQKLIATNDNRSSNNKHKNVEEVINTIDQLEAHVRYVQQMALLLWYNNSGDDDNNSGVGSSWWKQQEQNEFDWKTSLDTIRSILELRLSEPCFNALQDFNDSNVNHHALEQEGEQAGDLLWASRHLEQCWKVRTGVTLKGEQKYESFQEILLSLAELKTQIRHQPQQQQVHVILSNMIKMIQFKTQQANLLGYPNYTEMVMETRMATTYQVQTLHQEIAEKLMPIFLNHQSFYLEDDTMNDSNIVTSDNNMTVTLDGVLAGLFQITNELFGVSIHEEEEDQSESYVWDESVRIFHMYDQDNDNAYIGSFYLDVLHRPGKFQNSFMMPLCHRRANKHPVVGIHMNIQSPIWNDDTPVAVSWEEAEVIFHEFGHVLQVLLPKSPFGHVIGSPNLPGDVLEFVPKFMEFWLLEESTLHHILQQSSSNNKNDNVDMNELMQPLVQWRSKRKMMQMLQDAFLGSFEFQLFSSCGIGTGNGNKETTTDLWKLQNNIAKLYFPPEISSMAGTDISIWSTILQANSDFDARGGTYHEQHVAIYRYLWSEVLSAAVFQSFQKQEQQQQDRSALGKDFRCCFLDPGPRVDMEKSLCTKFNITITKEETISVDPILEVYGFS